MYPTPYRFSNAISLTEGLKTSDRLPLSPQGDTFYGMNQLKADSGNSGRDMDPLSLLAAAEEAATVCGKFLLEAYERPKSGYEEKSPGDLVSEVDRSSQSLAQEILLKHTPCARILAEEDADRPDGDTDSEVLTWIVDPLDGTANFLHRLPVFAISIAAARGRKLLAGVVYSPFTHECFSAALGCGATANGAPIRVSEESDLGRSLLATGWPFRRKEILAAYLDVFQSIFWACQGIRRLGAAAIDLAYTAAGRLEGFWEYGLNKWDVAAGALILREAGGVVSDFSGGDGWWDSGDIVASNGLIHSSLLEAAATPNGMADLEADS